MREALTLTLTLTLTHFMRETSAPPVHISMMMCSSRLTGSSKVSKTWFGFGLGSGLGLGLGLGLEGREDLDDVRVVERALCVRRRRERSGKRTTR